MAVIRCPNCGKPNPDFLEVCQYCDARLHAADGSPVDSRAPSSAEDTIIKPPAPPTPAPAPEPDDAQPLGWMDRLRQMQAGGTPPAATTAADEPDWMWTGNLRDTSVPKATSAAPTPPAAQDSAADLPEWLRDLGETGTLSPDMLPPAPAAPITSSPSPVTRSTPPELPAAPAAPITTPGAQLPVTPTTPAEPSPFEPTASDVTIPPRSRRKMTDWLDKLKDLPAPGTPAEPAEPPAPVIPNTDADLPDWLKAMAAEAEAPGSATPAVEAATQHLAPGAAPTPEDELPDWLRALRAKTETPRPAPGTGALQTRPPAGPSGPLARRNQELPQAMRPPAADETLIPRPGAKPLEPASDDMPDWLKGILSPAAGSAPAGSIAAGGAAPGATAASAAAADNQGAATDHPVILTGPAADAARKPGGSRPIGAAAARDVLPPEPSPSTSVTPPASAPAASLPPVSTPRASTSAAAPASAPTPPAMSITGQPVPPAAPPAPPAAIDDTLPPPSRRAKRLTDWLGKTPAPAAQVPPAEELPDWLKSLSAESAAKDAQAQQAAVPAQEVPDWLKTTPPAPTEPAAAATQPAAAPTEPVAAPITNYQLPITAAPAAAPADQMPDWVKAMAPPAAPEPPTAALSEELPDWLKGLATSAAPTDLPPSVAEPAAAASPITHSELPITTPPATPPAEPAAAPITNHELPITPEPAATPAEDLPDWLKDLAPSEPAPSAAEPAAAPITNYELPITPEPVATPAEDLPDWLKAITHDAAADSVLPATTVPAAASVAPPAPEAAPEALPADELPDWLKAITQAQAAEPPAAPQPAVLSQTVAPVRPPAPPEPPAVPEPAATAPLTESGEELPDWLKAITQASSAAATAATAAAASAAAPATAEPAAAAPITNYELPITTPPAEPAAEPITNSQLPITPEPAEPTPPPPPVNLPPWLVGVGTAPLPELQELPDLDEETLAWLSESKKAETTPEPAGLDLSGAKLPAEKPDWLNELAAVSTPPAASASAEPDIAPTPAEDMPEWLRTMRGQASQEAATTEAATPDWLRTLRGQGAATPAPATPATSAATVPASDTAAAAVPITTQSAQLPITAPTPPEGLTQAALPAWLAAMRPVDIEQPVPTAADSYEETLGVLAGMRGVLRAEPVVAQPHKASAAHQNLVISDANTAQVNLLNELLRPETTAPAARHGRARLGAHAERWLIFAVLLIALVLAQFQSQWQQFGLPALFAAPAASLPPESAAVYRIIQGLPTTKPALVAFDYDAAQAGELSPGAQAVVAQLAGRGVPVVAVSLDLTGPAIAEQVLSQSAASGSLNLGYIPGGPVGLLQFAASPPAAFSTDFAGQSQVWAQPPVASVRSLADFGMIVLVSGTPESTRAWVEQAQAYAPGVPMVAVISAGAEAMVRPYYDDPDANSIVAGHLPLKGLIVGLSGAAAYEQATAAPGAASALWPAMGGGLLAAVVIIVLGNLIFGVLGTFRRRRA